MARVTRIRIGPRRPALDERAAAAAREHPGGDAPPRLDGVLAPFPTPEAARRAVAACRAALAPVVDGERGLVDALLVLLCAKALDETTGDHLRFLRRSAESTSATTSRLGRIVTATLGWLEHATGEAWSVPALPEPVACRVVEALQHHSLLLTAADLDHGPEVLRALFDEVVGGRGALPEGSQFARGRSRERLIDEMAFRRRSPRRRTLCVAAAKAVGTLDVVKARNLDWMRGHHKRGEVEITNLPKLLQIEVSTVCNLRCQMCSISGPTWGREQRFIDLATIERLRPELAFISDCKLHGDGEPFLHPQIDRIVEIMQEEGVRLNTVTNATVIDERLARLIGESFSTLTISVDGVDEETFEHVRVRGRWEKLLRGIDLVNRFRGPDLRLIIGVVLLRCNIDQLPDLVRFAHDHGAQELQAAWMVPFEDLPWTHTQGLTDDPERTNRAMQEARRIGAELGISVRIPDDLPVEGRVAAAADQGPERGADRAGPVPSTIVDLDFVPDDYDLHGTTRVTGHCRLMYDRAMIRVHGEVKPCGQSIPLPALGSVLERSFDECWNGSAYQELRATFAAGTLPPTCRRCNFIRSKQLGTARLVHG